MKKVYDFLKNAGTYYLATVEGDQPRVRPFGTIDMFDGKLYIQTGLKKDVAKQLAMNPKAEICAFKDGQWIRISGKLILDDRREARKHMLDEFSEACTTRMTGTRQSTTLRMQLLQSPHSLHHLR